ncbi:hypothetical protein V7S43_006775 [Phytophthora oleae]|uniref:Uncharacterized protein n=1 Tax=Phytophthora oleae TaxID=2107226 RepID=A0ABD3FN76_9STRA
MKDVSDAIEDIIHKTDDNWQTKTSSWHALKSVSGSGRQDPHKDFPSFETSRALITKTAVQASVIVALMPGARFIILPRRFGSRRRKNFGIVKFYFYRGDVVHAGTDFVEENIRLHCFVLIKGIDQQTDFYRCYRIRNALSGQPACV